MDVLAILDVATKALSLIEQGRSALTGIQQSVADGKLVLDATTQDQLDQLLAAEEGRTSAAVADLRSAIAQYRAG